MRRRHFVGLIPVALLAACGGSDPVGGGGNPPPTPPPPPPPPPPGADPTVQIIDNAFVDPDGAQNAQARVEINAGQTVTWRHDGAIPHTVTSTSVPAGAAAFDSGTLNPSDTFQVTFTDVGTYVYRCDLHPNVMRDSEVVVT